MSEKDDLTITEAAKFLGLSRWTVKGYVHSGQLPSRLARKGRMEVRFIRKEDLEAFRTEQAGNPGYSGTSVLYGRSRVEKVEEDQVNLVYLVKEATQRQEAEIKTLQKEVQDLRKQLREYESLPWVPQYRRLAKLARLT